MESSGEQAESKLRWSVEQRLEFIEFRLFWDGRVNRSDLVDFFDISVPQASADLAKYQQIAAGNITYDKTAKTYVATPGFRPVVFTPSADRFLARLRSNAADVLTKDALWLDHVPPVGAVPLLRRRVEPEILRRVLHAMRNRVAVHVHYQSVSTVGPQWRWIAPHALGFDGFRWHARSWCYNRADFRDFVLTRIMECTETKASDVDVSNDREWHLDVTHRLAPHPALSEGIRKAIEVDYGMVDGVLEVSTKIALSLYFERLHGLDLDPKQLPEFRQQLVLVNREDVNIARQRAREASQQMAKARIVNPPSATTKPTTPGV